MHLHQRKTYRALALLLLLLLSFRIGYAWNSRGHMLIAAIAYSQLSPEKKKEITDLLRNHPDYSQWREKYEGYEDDIEFGMFMMMQAATWPDDIRSNNNPGHQFHRPEWHYVTYKIKFPNGHETKLPNPTIEPNVVWAIDYSKDKVNTLQLGKGERAMYLAWLIHLIGDIHQPLHCGSIFDKTYPDGDLGGNKFYVKPNAAGVKLHSFWDGSLGSGENLRSIKNQSSKVKNENPVKGIDTKHAPTTWSIESFDHVVKDVHLNGKLEGSDEKESAPALPDGYTTDMKILASKRAAMAGYRLGATIQSLSVSTFPDQEEE